MRFFFSFAETSRPAKNRRKRKGAAGGGNAAGGGPGGGGGGGGGIGSKKRSPGPNFSLASQVFLFFFFALKQEIHAISSYKDQVLDPPEFKGHQYVLDFGKLRTKTWKLFL